MSTIPTKKGNERKYELAAALQRSADPCFFLPIIQSTLYYYVLEMLCSVNKSNMIILGIGCDLVKKDFKESGLFFPSKCVE